MSDERTPHEGSTLVPSRVAEPEAKATIALVYKLVNELSASVDEKLGEMDATLREQFRDLRTAIESLRGEIPTRRECQYRHDEVDATVTAAVKASEDDRQKLWVAIHAVEGQLKWAAGIVITAFLGIIIFMLQGHFTP